MKAKNQMFDNTKPVLFMAEIDRMSITVDGNKAHEKRRYFAMIAMKVTTWQEHRQVAVPFYPN